MKDLQDIKNIRGKDVMEDFTIASLDDTIKEVSKSIVSNNTSEAIIINKEGNVVGIVTLRDIVRAIGNGINPESKVKDIMIKNVIVGYEDETLDEILIRMAKHNIARIPILNSNNEIVGVVSEKVLLKIIPSLYEILEEEISLNEPQISTAEQKSSEGICEMCEQYSEELIEHNGRFICKECYEELEGKI